MEEQLISQFQKVDASLGFLLTLGIFYDEQLDKARSPKRIRLLKRIKSPLDYHTMNAIAEKKRLRARIDELYN